MKVKSNEELKALIKDGAIVINGDLECDFNIDVEVDLIVKGDVSARNVSAWDISAGDISARNISARNISAGDISYFAFCIAYKSIKCKSIVGRRKNSLHKTLDGKVEIKGGE